MHTGAGRSPIPLWLWRRKLYMQGRLITEEIAHRSCVVLAPHPDDETLGCGATIVRKRRIGTPVKVVVATDGRHSSRSNIITEWTLAKIRKDEAVRAVTALGVDPKDLVMLEYEDGSLEQHAGTLTDHLKEIIQAFGPEEILVASTRDWHPDHVVLGRALRSMLPSLSSVRYAAEYPTWFWFAGPYGFTQPTSLLRRTRDIWRAAMADSPGFHPDLVATNGCLQEKRKAFREYRSQTVNLTGESTWNLLSDEFCESFFGPYEVFFPFRNASHDWGPHSGSLA